MVRSTINKAERVERYGALFEEVGVRLSETSGSLLALPRQRAMARFLEMGFPTTRDEDWRYTRLDPLWKTAFAPVLQPSDSGLSVADIRGFSPFDGDGVQLVFINGHYSSELSSTELISEDSVCSLAQASVRHPDLVRTHLNRHLPFEEQAFAALNTAFVQDGAFVRVGKRATIDYPIHLIYVTTDTYGQVFNSPRNLFVAESGSRASIVETHICCGDRPSLNNAASEIVLEEGATLDHCKIQRGGDAAVHLDTMFMVAASNSSFKSTCVTIGGGLTRNNVTTVLDGEGIDSTLNGLYVVDGEEHVDNHTLIEHARSSCESHEFYKGILDESATAAFRGRILVRRPAQKTDAYQSNQNLLLSKKAEVNTRPQLEIYADDVKCSHGATVGQLDENAIFYLRSRGVGFEQAYDVLTRAFADEVVDRITIEPLRAMVATLVSEKLESGRMGRAS